MTSFFSKKSWKKWIALFAILFIFIPIIGISVVYANQQQIVHEMVDYLNEDFQGKLEIEGSHISPFANFPYVSIDLENVKVYEGKEKDSPILLHLEDTYIGFDIWSMMGGEYDIKAIRLEGGFIKLVQHVDGTFNIANALTSSSDSITHEEDHLHLELNAVNLKNIDLMKLNEENNLLAEAFINEAKSSFKTSSEHTYIELDSKFLFNLIADGDTTFLHDKHIDLHTTLDLDAKTGKLEILPSELNIEKALFEMEGSVDFENDMFLDLHFKGNKPNFNLFLAFAPPEIMPVLERYENGGRIYFDARVKGKSINGHNPAVNVDFGCQEAFINNKEADKSVNELYFEGHFTNGEKQNASTMALDILDFSAKPEAGNFSGKLNVVNFDSPDIDLQLKSDFNLDFLAEFLNIQNLQDVTGKISLTMNFHDIIDLEHPERSIEKLNESYYTVLKIDNLNFNSSQYPLPINDVNVDITMDGHAAEIKKLEGKIGSSDISITASISDLPAILHHTDLPVEAILDINSSKIDLRELTSVNEDSAKINEVITNLRTRFKFKSSARAFTESPNLPVGEFFIEKLHANLKNYPHELHDFNADIMVDNENFQIIDFTGMIDESDFHFNGRLENYDLWFEEGPRGSTKIDFHLNSDVLQLDDLFAYGGENHVPEDYRHEEFTDLHLKGIAKLEFNKKLLSSHITIEALETNMKVHHMRFEKFNGEFFIDSTAIKATNVGGKIGNSNFKIDFNYDLSEDTVNHHHTFKLTAPHLDFDQLFAYNPSPEDQEMTPEDHEAGFNIFEVPFSNMDFSFDIGHLNYHRYLLDDFLLKGRMKKNHYIYVDTMSLKAAGGKIDLNGYFNGSNPKAIYFSPKMQVKNVDLDQLLFKFENFGQDHLVSENLHGKLSGSINGKVHMHADMVPIIDDSELHINLKVVNGSLNHYPAFDALSDYFGDKNLSNVRFDTLQNKLDLKNGYLSIPSMNINSTIGFFEISGKQNMDMDMEYYLRIPLEVVTKAGMQKLFGKKKEATSDQVDEIQYRDENKNVRFINIKIEGTPDDFEISLGKDKS
ncbi:hypothetical protein OO013_05210 [Mangrovivirga sp. M17]|uniref:AsmA-like C-terminal domain-containing protein n=1 Tax=Mangrovivirga halotolerans TaxID=2993936 RepID=A0ABT3RN70_9BACT|nr:AsmA-like C-terminal region-containing protein [Mangrovivirga halotolerans]MCX2743252.1 hypothetical protein [Mangrovivirga halotolerans]